MLTWLTLLYGIHYLKSVTAGTNTVVLDYATYEGTVNSDGTTQWLGMRYAAAPIGNLRFAAPQDPPVVQGVQKAVEHGNVCLGTGQNPRVGGPSEDCLFVDVYAPTDATPESKLPVYFFIQGGGFNFNANANYNGSGLVTASGNNIIVVTFNYRVGLYGFLAGREVDSLNNGLKDQRKALEWVHKYIDKFGGDAGHVVLGGGSAGAASVSFLLTAYGGRDDKLFVGAAAESVSFATILTIDESQYQLDALAKRLKCPTGTNSGKDTLICLRSKSSAELQQHNHNIPYPGNRQSPLFMWNPVLDGALIQNYTYAAFEDGAFVHVPVIIGDDTNGGTVFTPRQTKSQKQSDTFLRNQFPFLSSKQLSRISALFPNAGPTFPETGSWWRQVSNAYGNMRYMCPNLFITSALARYGNKGNWNYRYNVEDSAQVKIGLGVPHIVELGAIWGPTNVHGSAPSSYQEGGSNHWIVPLIQGYWTSFIRALDPNVYRIPGSPTWDEFITAGSTGSNSETVDVDALDWRRMIFDTQDTTGMEEVSTSVRSQCQYLNSIGVSIRQ
ncbi:hypothetical protein PV08_10779 [Exophiala spinifera]|uniref:Carboxylic ester hydrolase n=1 Tax=Exophiala spinifera TaxID=91928 RepID=A0A0D2BJJ3_9EURO|nr:uncharacterized protein PV08_10779 [Exophiala spinifera]KIW11479.1 hypothetical protein PV08_10779 [Exophiala spinifera]